MHEPLIDSFYGPDKMLSLIEMLQVRCFLEEVTRRNMEHFEVLLKSLIVIYIFDCCLCSL